MALRQILACALAGAMALPAQNAGQNMIGQNAANNGLKVVVLEGEGARNSIPSGRGVAPIVEVRDDQDKPVAGASVTFETPAEGASANFFGWLRTQTVKTDAKGSASASGYTPNAMNGKFQVKVTAVMGTKSGMAMVNQSNANGSSGAASPSTAATKPSNNKIKILAILGVAAIAGGIAAAKSGGSSTAATAPPVPVTITSGSVTVAGPR